MNTSLVKWNFLEVVMVLNWKASSFFFNVLNANMTEDYISLECFSV